MTFFLSKMFLSKLSLPAGISDAAQDGQIYHIVMFTGEASQKKQTNKKKPVGIVNDDIKDVLLFFCFITFIGWH